MGKKKAKKRDAKSRAKRDVKDKGQFLKVFRDPVHDLILLRPDDEFILDLIDTKEFQRLRRIRQLGLAHYVFPGAEHSRFTHSLGVFNFARRIIDSLMAKGNSEARKEIKLHERTIKAAALLHDIGHGPFSHLYERLFSDSKKARDHEAWSCKIILERSTDVNKCLKKHKIDAREVVGLIDSDYPTAVAPQQPYLKDIVSSQLDADRMDYLLRDSLLTGSRYGQFDSEWILNAMSIGQRRLGPKRQIMKKLCLDERKGTGGIEELLLARLLMTRHVYGHRTTRAYESELLCTLRLARSICRHLPKETPKILSRALSAKGDLSVKEYLLLDDSVVWLALRTWATWEPKLLGKSKQLGESLARHSLRLVRRLKPWRTAILQAAQDHLRVESMIQQLHEDGDPLYFECQADDGKILPYKDIVRLTQARDDEEAYFEDIFLLFKSGTAEPLSASGEGQSPILKALTVESKSFRFFYDEKYEKTFRSLLKEYEVRYMLGT